MKNDYILIEYNHIYYTTIHKFIYLWLQALPKTLHKATSLVTFRASGNKVRKLPPKIGESKTLRFLYVQNNLLKSLPKTIYKIPVEVNASDNTIKELPKIALTKKVMPQSPQRNMISKFFDRCSSWAQKYAFRGIVYYQVLLLQEKKKRTFTVKANHDPLICWQSEMSPVQCNQSTCSMSRLIQNQSFYEPFLAWTKSWLSKSALTTFFCTFFTVLWSTLLTLMFI